MKITEIFDVQNADSNLILSQSTYILIHDYENYKNRLRNHSATLELLTQRALNLNLSRGFPQKLKLSKPTYQTKNEKSKQLQIGIMNGELLVIKKLLLMNLRSLKIMQKLFHENKELQMLLNDSRAFAKKQRQKVVHVKREKENLKKTEIQLKKRLGTLFHQFNRVSKSFIDGFKEDYQDDCNKKVPLSNDTTDRNSRRLKFAFNFSANVTYRLRNEESKFLQINNIHQEVSFNCNLDIVLQDFKIRLTPSISELPLNNFFITNVENMHKDHEIKYPLLMWQPKKPIESHIEKSDSKELNPEVEKYPYKIDKEVQNAIRLYYVNSSIWKSFLVVKTIQEFTIFNETFELTKAFLLAGKICGSEEISSETDQTMLFRPDNFNVHSCASASSNETVNQSSLILDEALNKRISEYPKKVFPRIKVFYNLKNIHIKVVNRNCGNRKIRKRIFEAQCISTISSVSIGVGDSYIESVDQESQVDNDIIVKPAIESNWHETNVIIKNNELNQEDSSIKTLYTSRRDFKKSLKSLEDVIKSCQRKCEQESTMKLRDKSSKKAFNSLEKNVNPQRKPNTKEKEVKNRKQMSIDSYMTENRTISRLPKMSKMYQIILENRLPRGVIFEYLTPNKSKVQLLFVSKSQDTKMI